MIRASLKIVVSGNADDIEQAEKELLEKTSKLENQKSFALRKQQAYDNAIQLLSDEVEIWNRIKKGVSRSIKTQKIKPTILKLKTAYDEFYKLYDESIDELREFYPEELKALCLPDIHLLKQSMQINKRQFLFKEDLSR